MQFSWFFLIWGAIQTEIQPPLQLFWSMEEKASSRNGWYEPRAPVLRFIALFVNLLLFKANKLIHSVVRDDTGWFSTGHGYKMMLGRAPEVLGTVYPAIPWPGPRPAGAVPPPPFPDKRPRGMTSIFPLVSLFSFPTPSPGFSSVLLPQSLCCFFLSNWSSPGNH